MKAYKLEILVIDHENVGESEIVDIIENTHYPNYCIVPQVKDVKVAEIGEWHDDHPLNKNDSSISEYKRLFSNIPTDQEN